MQLIPLTPELHARLAANVTDESVRTFGADPVATAQHCNEFGFALMKGRDPVAAGGLIPIWPGHAEAWLMVAQNTPAKLLVPALRHAAKRLDHWQQLPAYRRVQIYIRRDAKWRDSFAAALGFALEGWHKAWGPDGADYMCYARIANWRQLDAIGSYYDAIAAIRDSVAAGAPPPTTGYFERVR